MTAYKLQLLNKKDYPQLTPSDKVYYSKYPYKVKLKDNIVFYDSQRWSEILDWFYPNNTQHAGIRSAFSRIVYLDSKELLDEFIHFFADQIITISGPVSKAHIKMLQTKVNKTARYQEYEIRQQKWFREYDTKVHFFVPFYRNTNYSVGSGFSNYQTRAEEVYKALETATNVLEDFKVYGSVRRTRFIYMQKEELEDLELFIKLKHPGIKLLKTSCLEIR